MPVTLEQTGTNPAAAGPRSAFVLRFISTVALWTVALLIMFSGYEILFWLLISVFGMIGLWEFYRMLDHKGLPNFKITGMICGAVMLAGSFYYFSKIGPAGSYDFEVAVLLFFLLTVFGRQMFAGLRHDAPLQTAKQKARRRLRLSTNGSQPNSTNCRSFNRHSTKKSLPAKRCAPRMRA